MKKFLILTACLIACYASPCFAQAKQPTPIKPKIKPFYITNAIDGAIFSSAFIKHNDVSSTGRVRFSFLNVGVNFHFNFNEHIGAFTGIGIKNIGFIEDPNAIIIKRRVYSIGVPVGIKVGNMEMDKPYGYIGGGVDAPFNYREKQFQIQNQKTKFNEWFSGRTPAVMPYVFIGAQITKRWNLKAQYYPGNFLNPNFKDKNGLTPYAGYDVQLTQLTVGYTVTRKKDRQSIEANNISEE